MGKLEIYVFKINTIFSFPSEISKSINYVWIYNIIVSWIEKRSGFPFILPICMANRMGDTFFILSCFFFILIFICFTPQPTGIRVRMRHVRA